MAKRIVVLTGGIGSGKTAAAQFLSSLGVAIVDADEISKSLTGPGGEAIAAIRERFGDQFICSDGSLDREKMRSKVFADPDSRIALQAIIHPLVHTIAQEALSNAPGPYAIYAAPLWVELRGEKSGKKPGFKPQKVVVIDCEPGVQLLRVMQRNGLSQAEIQSMIDAQASREERLKAADIVISNNGKIEELYQQLLKMHEDLIQT